MISVIIPIYNSEKNINECIKSILSQTYKNFELILVDDGSTDNSSKICDIYKKKDKRVKVLHKKNSGVGSARNSGIEVASGDYITFVDSDDYIDNNFLESCIRNINDNDLYISGITMEYYKDKQLFKSTNYSIKKQSIFNIKQLFDNLKVNYPPICICGPCCKLYKLSIIKKYSIRFDEKISFGEDTIFNLDYFKNINSVFFDNATFYHYRRENPESLFSRYHKDIYYLHENEYNKMRNLMNEVGCNDITMSNFEQMYTGLMIGSIQHVFKNTKDKQSRKQVIKNVINNQYVKKTSLKKFDLIHKFLVVCIKYKFKIILYFIFSLRNFGKVNN